MGLFGSLFKKKDDFDSLLKDPLTEPFGKPEGQNPFSQAQGQDQTFDTGFLGQEGGGRYSSPMSPDNFSTSATELGGQGPRFESFPAQKRQNGPEVYEEMQFPQKREQITIEKRELEMISLKLDTIKSQLESLNQKVGNLERKNYEEEAPRPRRYAW